MDNKELSGMEPLNPHSEEIPVLPPEEPPVFVDYFADILPDVPGDNTIPESYEEEPLPVPEAPAPAEPEEPDYEAAVMAAAEETLAQDIPGVTTEDTVIFHIPETLSQIGETAEEASVAMTEQNSGELLPQEEPADTTPVTTEPEAAQEAAPIPRPVRKGRPRRRKGEFLFGLPQIAVTCVWLAIILVTGITLGRMAWVCAADVLAFGREDKQVTITVYESDTMDDIIEKLHKGGLIHYPGLFRLYADLAVDEGEIKPGIWDLNTMYDYHALVNMMSPSSSRTVVEDVLIPEGFTCRQIFALLEENRVCTAKDLAEYAASGELKDYWFLENLERGDEYCLEGFLFPDTYDFYKNSSPRDVLEKMLDNFDYRFDEEMRAQIDTLNANVTENTFDIHKVVIVASMIEKETASNKESPLIASVIYNRLFDWGGTPAFLNIDASIVYALDGKTELTTEDLQIDSPYNTYTNIGLTPGAISNPGLASLKAALNPADSDYYFYVLNPAEGVHKFSKTLDEHNEFIASLR
ncbi:MAG: endolytic transglycosylase MltG [Oscillospiraceae bacterium]|nr:endolytic transglycosylase MltG [Oscillospiraceae bacterium]